MKARLYRKFLWWVLGWQGYFDPRPEMKTMPETKTKNRLMRQIEEEEFKKHPTVAYLDNLKQIDEFTKFWVRVKWYVNEGVFGYYS